VDGRVVDGVVGAGADADALGRVVEGDVGAAADGRVVDGAAVDGAAGAVIDADAEFSRSTVSASV
jgi:hypothetical protein